MNLRIYEYILAVARTGHFGKAADDCNVSQPTLSQQIKKYEDYIGMPIFERDNKNVQLTRNGKELLPYLKTVLDANKTLRQAVQNLKNPEEGRLYLGAFPTLAPFYIPNVLPRLNKAFPKLNLFWVEERSPDLITLLKNGEIDAAFLALPLDTSDEFEVMPLFQEKLVAAVPASSSLARQKILSLKDLKDEPLLLLEDSHCLSGQALEACKWAGLKNRHDFRATSIETLRHMVGSGLGITLVPEMAVNTNFENVTYVPLKESNAQRTIGLVRRKTSPIKGMLDKVVDLLKYNPTKET